jgi:hypothetical protein
MFALRSRSADANLNMKAQLAIATVKRSRPMRYTSISGQTTVTQELSMVRFLKMLLRGTPVGILADLTMKMSQPAVIFVHLVSECESQ